MVWKHNLTGLVGGNGFFGLYGAVNNAHGGFVLSYAVLFLVFVFVFYSVHRISHDTGKSFLQALFVSGFVGVLLFYAGEFMGVALVDGLVLLGVFVLLSIGYAVLRFARQHKEEDR